MTKFNTDQAQEQTIGTHNNLTDVQQSIYERMMVAITPYEPDEITGELPDTEHPSYNKSFYIAWDRQLNASCNSKDGAKNFYNTVNDRLVEMRRDDPQMVDDKTFNQMIYTRKQHGIYQSLLDQYNDLDAAYNQACGHFFDKDAFDAQWTNNSNKKPTAKVMKLRNDLIAEYQAEENARAAQAKKDGDLFDNKDSLDNLLND
tara:strand:- start:162 stop:767 length:606 start_codon:yes stop_codon:yes gene_type:complete